MLWRDGGDSSQGGGDGTTAVQEAEATDIQISKYVGGVALTEGGVDTAIRENSLLY